MARESISKIAYKTLQQSKSIAGFAHKQISSRLMNFILPDSKLENFNIDRELLMQIQNSMDFLREEDWNDAEKNIYPKKLLFDEPWLRYLTQYPKIWLDSLIHGTDAENKTLMIFQNQLKKIIILNITSVSYTHLTLPTNGTV